MRREFGEAGRVRRTLSEGEKEGKKVGGSILDCRVIIRKVWKVCQAVPVPKSPIIRDPYLLSCIRPT